MGSLLMVVGNLVFLTVIPQGESTGNITLQSRPANVTTSTRSAGSSIAQRSGSTDNSTLQTRPASIPTSTGLAGGSIAKQTATVAVNITEKACAFIQEMNQTWHDITSSGITSEYAYWKGKHNLPGEYPIHAYAGGVNCSKRMYDYSDADVKLALFVWYIPQKIYSPVKIKVNVTLPQYTKQGFKKKNITVNFNNRSIIIRRSPRGKRVRRTEGLDKVIEIFGISLVAMHAEICRDYIQMCPFTVNVTFHGWFAYETVDPKSGSHFYSVGIGVLRDKPKGLIRLKHNRLSYLIRGWFKRVTFWKSRDT